MYLEFLILGGYGQFVWSAYIFTFVSCFTLYVKIKREFQKQEKMFLKEFNQIQNGKMETTKKKEVLSCSPIY